MQGLAFDNDLQVVAAGDQVAGFHLGKAVDAFGYFVESAAALGCKFDFDNAGDGFFLGFLGVEDGFVAEDDSVVFEFLNLGLDGFFVAVEPFGDLRDWGACVILQNVEYFVHGACAPELRLVLP